jgi:hypothetical protein
MSFPKAHPGLRIGNLASDVVCELFLDFACPYSRKMVKTITPLLAADEYKGKICFTFHNLIQPWHHQSLWLHEISYAVKMVRPDFLWPFWQALFEQAPDWYDKEVFTLSRPEFYDKIAARAAGICTEDGKTGDKDILKADLLRWLIPPKQPRGDYPEEARSLGCKSCCVLLGPSVEPRNISSHAICFAFCHTLCLCLHTASPDDDENALFPFTLQTVKFHRKRGVHTTPTVFFNGIEQTTISSSWDETQWKAFLDAALSK